MCDPCHGSGSGNIPIPNGCAECESCCPCVCWWYTNWHKSLTKTNFMRATLVAPVWTLTGNNLVNIGGNPDYLYLGSIGGGQIGGLSAIDGSNNITGAVPPNPAWSGNLTYSDGSTTVTVNVTIHLTFVLPCPCDGSFADSMVWSGTAVNSVSPAGYSFDLNGSITPPVGPPGSVDYAPLPNDIIGGSGTFASCGGTIAIDGTGITMPSMTIVPMYVPGCTP